MFLLADLTVGVQTAVRAPLCSSLFQVFTTEEGGDLSWWRRSPWSRVKATDEDLIGQPAGTFGAHRGARFKTSVPPQVFKSLVAVFVKEVLQDFSRFTVHRQDCAVSPIAFGAISVFVVHCCSSDRFTVSAQKFVQFAPLIAVRLKFVEDPPLFVDSWWFPLFPPIVFRSNSVFTGCSSVQFEFPLFSSSF